MSGVNNKEIPAKVKAREAFTNRGESVSASKIDGRPGAGLKLGELPNRYRRQILAALESGRLIYVVYSYETPVAWIVKRNGEIVWIEPDVKYSITTSKHVGLIRMGYGNLPVASF